MIAVTPDSEQTQRLLDEARQGRDQAVDKLLTRHRAYLRQFVELNLDARLRARVDPSDVVQEAQLEAVRRLDNYLDKEPMPFRLWLRQLAQDRLLMMRRRHVQRARRTVALELVLPEQSSCLLAQQLLAKGSTPSQKLEQEELARRVRQAVAQLADADRDILIMRTFEGLSFAEVSYLLKIDAAAARKRHGRALLRLHKILSHDGLGSLEE